VPLPDSNEVDEAVLAVLTGDTALRALLPGGVWFDLTGSPNLTRYGLVSQLHHEDMPAVHSEGGWERYLYLVKAVVLATDSSTVKAAAYRIHQLLHDTTYPVDGYVLMLSQRVERVRYAELDEVTDENWLHRGGQYEVFVAPVQSGEEIAA
jgi:hypothetical protein